jgi:hypothetical protein
MQMLMTEMAVLDLRVRFMNIKDAVRRLLGLPVAEMPAGSQDMAQGYVPLAGSVLTENGLPVSEDAPQAFRWRRHPLLRNASATSPLSGKEQRARRLAVQGLYAGLRGDTDQARQLFHHAIGEAHIDLTGIPSFWQMPRAAIVAAADAYEQAGRLREATALRARIRSELRPRNVVQLRPVELLPERKRSVGGT